MVADTMSQSRSQESRGDRDTGGVFPVERGVSFRLRGALWGGRHNAAKFSDLTV